MQSRLISIIIGAILIIDIGSFVYTTKKPIIDNSIDNVKTQIPSTSVKKATLPSTQTTGGTTDSISLAVIASHNSRSSCWSAINGNVYDLTSWIPNHPGGERTILSICGIDGSGDYNGQHGGSSRIAKILGGFKVGVLK